tara:strand:+ start:41 stop:286 length:246 start_codon:yes stop_codon:yes gene_type:complete
MSWKEQLNKESAIPPEVVKQIDNMVEAWIESFETSGIKEMMSRLSHPNPNYVEQMTTKLREGLEERYRTGQWDGTENYFPK